MGMGKGVSSPHIFVAFSCFVANNAPKQIQRVLIEIAPCTPILSVTGIGQVNWRSSNEFS